MTEKSTHVEAEARIAAAAKPGDEQAADAVIRLLRIMRSLRGEGGCPWDQEQTHQSLARYAIEEVYELVDAIDRNAEDEMRGELGDVLLQVVFHAQIAEERGAFSLKDVADGIGEKLVRRHPHVFGEETAEDADDVNAIWEQAKDAERDGQRRDPMHVDAGLPSLLRALKLTKKASRLGFDWDRASDVVPILEGEVAELRVEVEAGDRERSGEELGDVLFSAVNLARKLKLDPDELLRAANRKFERRFEGVRSLAEERGLRLSEMSLTEMDVLWDEVKLQRREGRKDG